MNRLRDYFGFAVWFAGLGYIAIWPLSTAGRANAPFGAWLVCPTAEPEVLGWLCRAPHPFTLSPTLHLLGLASAVVVMLGLTRRALCHVRRARLGRVLPKRVVQVPAVLMPLPKPRRPLPKVKPRGHFGLRGAPR